MRIVLIVASCLLFAGSATAEPQLDDISQPLNHPFQLWLQGKCSVGECAFFFSAVTQRSVVTHVSCEVTVPDGSKIIAAALYSENPRNTLPVFAYASDAGNTDYGINSDVLLSYEIGKAPEVRIHSRGPVLKFTSCTLSGYALP